MKLTSFSRLLTAVTSYAWKVDVSLYYEAYCPASVGFIVNILKPLIDSEYIYEHINLNLVPFGNAGYDPTGRRYTCQHGPQECKINRFQGCIIKYSGGDQRQVFNAIYKGEYAISRGNTSDWMNYSIAGLPHPDAVWNCMNSEESWGVVEEFANETGSLQPPHGWTPWPTINGKPVKGDFKAALCTAFEAKGGACPAAHLVV